MSVALDLERKLKLSDEVRLRVRSEIVEKRSKFNKFKDRQKDNFARIKEEIVRKAKNFSPNVRTNRNKFESGSRYSKTLTDFNESDEEISSKMKSLE